MVNSLYIHIPFCRKKCLYCDFYSIVYRKELASVYIDVLCRQIENLQGNFETIYIGGGTPTVLDIFLWEKLLLALEKVIGRQCEFTVEANPESLDEDKIKLFRERRVNRISIGVQSLSDEKLEKLGRIHTAQEAVDKVYRVRKEGFDNINIDIIFGVWGETLNSWKKELKEVLKLPITHLSVYSLTYEKNTPLFRKVRSREVIPLKEETVAQMYKYNMDYLPREGFFQYEVSNFARNSYHCQHNLNYWRNDFYLGLGASSVSYLDGVRQRYISDVGEYIKRARKAESLIAFKEKLKPLKRARETAALKIRTKEGISFKWFKEKTGFNFLHLLEEEKIKKLKAEKLLRIRQKRGKLEGIYLTRRGFLFCDRVSRSFL